MSAELCKTLTDDRGMSTYSLFIETGSHEKIRAPKNAPIKIHMMMYPLKYMANSIIK